MRALRIAALSLLLSQSAVAGQVPVSPPSPYGSVPAGIVVAHSVETGLAKYVHVRCSFETVPSVPGTG